MRYVSSLSVSGRDVYGLDRPVEVACEFDAVAFGEEDGECVGLVVLGEIRKRLLKVLYGLLLVCPARSFPFTVIRYGHEIESVRTLGDDGETCKAKDLFYALYYRR